MLGTVFVTVGTTKFDALIQAVDTPEFADALISKGYKKLVIQKGAGRYQLQTLVPLGSQHHQLCNGLQIEVFEFAPSLADHMKAADLIISHAGSGSIFEALRLRKTLVAVPNAILMDNHQAELADHLAHLQYIVSAKPDTLTRTLQHLSVDGLRPYESGNAEGIIARINTVVSSGPASKSPLIMLACLLAVCIFGMMFVILQMLLPRTAQEFSGSV